jgi:primosomal protein N''
MQITANFYLSIVGLFAASLAAYLLLPHGEVIQSLAAIPLVGSLVAALLQLLKDMAAHEKAIAMQAADQRFALGASSHMANVAFDKHVEFCESYVQEVFSTLETLFKNGPSDQALQHAFKLAEQRRKFALWLTPKIEAQLQEFEKALRAIGADDWYLRNADRIDNRHEIVERLYKKFADVLGVENMGANEWQGQPLTPELAIYAVVQGLRHVLKVEELTGLREALVQAALIKSQSK